MTNSSRMQHRSGRLSHEARLGVMLISVLVFTFGFMVYRRVDLHHSSFQSAAIPSAAPPGDHSDAEPAAQDPLQALTDSIVFSEPAVASPSLDSWRDAEAENSTAAAVSFSQFPEEPETTPGNRQQNLVAAEADTFLAATDTVDNTDSAAIPFADVFDAQPVPDGPPEFEAATPAAATATVSMSGFAEFDQQLPAVDSQPAPELTAFDRGIAAAEQSATAFADSADTSPNPFPVIDTVPQGDFASPSDPAFPLPELFETADGGAENPSSAESSGGVESFPDFDRGVPSGIPQPETLIAAADEFNTFPEIIPEEPPAAVRPAPTTGFPSATFENPTGPFGQNSFSSTPSRTPARTASGAGRDGRFSVAAWNYQNSTVIPEPDPDRTYKTAKVETGDNYYTISRRVYGSTRYFSALALFNQHRIPDPRRMRPGMIVLIPEAKELEQKFPEFFAENNRQALSPGFFLLDDGTPAYRTGERETLSEISQRFLGRASRWIEIYELNRSVISSPNNLRPGTVLGLPGDAVEVQIIP